MSILSSTHSGKCLYAKQQLIDNIKRQYYKQAASCMSTQQLLISIKNNIYIEVKLYTDDAMYRASHKGDGYVRLDIIEVDSSDKLDECIDRDLERFVHNNWPYNLDWIKINEEFKNLHHI